MVCGDYKCVLVMDLAQHGQSLLYAFIANLDMIIELRAATEQLFYG